MYRDKYAAIRDVVEREGGYTNHPNDRGGETKFGITKESARKAGYQGPMTEYTLDEAVDVYYKHYWEDQQLDRIAYIDMELTIRLFDFSVNSGCVRAVKFLQRLLNVLNNRQEYYEDLKVDGIIGMQTVIALTKFRHKRGANGVSVLSEALNGLRIAFCVGISERDESQEVFSFGWLSRVVSL